MNFREQKIGYLQFKQGTTPGSPVPDTWVDDSCTRIPEEFELGDVIRTDPQGIPIMAIFVRKNE